MMIKNSFIKNNVAELFNIYMQISNKELQCILFIIYQLKGNFKMDNKHVYK